MPQSISAETNIRELVFTLPMAEEVLKAFGLQCGGCGVNKYETIAQGAAAHGLRVEPILTALAQAQRAGRLPTISNEDKRPQRRAPGSFHRRAAFRYVVPIMSGKGGVGKSLMTGLLAVGLRRMGKRVGILDADITGPSIPRLFGLRDRLEIADDPSGAPAGGEQRRLMVPLRSRSAIEIVSSNLLTDQEDTAMIWRGPILSGVIRQFYEQVLWDDPDYLLIDLPPGTSDAPLTVLQSLDINGVVLVTMPQALATMIVRKAANLIHQLKKPVIGVIENMSYFLAPDTGKQYDIFGPSHAQQVAELAHAPVLARVPLKPEIMALADTGRIEETEDPICDTLARALDAIMETIPKERETISLL
jgi:hybrid cluster-associated redox disulfide protein